MLRIIAILFFGLLPMGAVASEQVDDLAGSWLMKFPIGSLHWPDKSSSNDSDFKEDQFGTGAGVAYQLKQGNITATASVTTFIDSHECRAVHAQYRMTYQLTNWSRVGGSVNMADKCINADDGNQFVFAPLGAVVIELGSEPLLNLPDGYTLDLAFDFMAANLMPDEYDDWGNREDKYGFVAISLEMQFLF